MMASWSFLNFQTGRIWLFWAYLFVVWQLSSSLHWQSSDIFHKSTPLKSTETVKKERQMRNSWIENPLKNVLTLTSRKAKGILIYSGNFEKRENVDLFFFQNSFPQWRVCSERNRHSDWPAQPDVPPLYDIPVLRLLQQQQQPSFLFLLLLPFATGRIAAGLVRNIPPFFFTSFFVLPFIPHFIWQVDTPTTTTTHAMIHSLFEGYYITRWNVFFSPPIFYWYSASPFFSPSSSTSVSVYFFFFRWFVSQR